MSKNFVEIFRNSDISEEAEQIIKGLLQLSPEQRLTASQVRDKLKLIIDCKSVKDTDRLVPDINDDAAVPKSSATSKRYLKTKQSTKVCICNQYDMDGSLIKLFFIFLIIA